MATDAWTADAVIASLADALIFADLEGTIRIWNAAAQAVFGFTADEAIGQNLDLIIPERLRPAHWAGFDRAMQSGVTKLGGRATLTRGLHKDGRRLYVDMSFAIVRSATGVTVGSVAVARDVTAREEARRANAAPAADPPARPPEPPQ
jgi:PAS domain S-box-containing protein